MRGNRKLRIGMVLDKELPDLRVENEANVLGQAGYDVVLLVLDYKEKSAHRERKGSYSVYYQPLKKMIVKKLRPFSGTIFDIYSLIWYPLISRFVKRENIDILHLHDLYMGLSVIGKNMPFIVDLHENYPSSVVSYNWSRKFPLNFILSKSVWKKREKQIFSAARGIITLSNYFADLLSKEYEALCLDKRFCVYPNVPSINDLENMISDKEIYHGEKRFTLFYYGVVAERRGIFECFEALKRLQKDLPQIHLLVVGPVDNADKNRFENYKADLRSSVTHIPWVKFSDFASLVKEVDIGISPIKKNEQHESGVANKIFQYMYFKKPLIVSNCRPQEEIVEKAKCGYVYESGNISDFCDKIIQAYRERASFADMGNNGNTAVKKKYNTVIAGKSLVGFYDRIN